MKNNATQLYPNEEVNKKVSDYAYEHSTGLSQHIIEHHEWGSGQEMSNYMISPLQEQYHIWFAKSIGAKRRLFMETLPPFSSSDIMAVLEIGCYIGFSALGWADAVGQEGHVTSLEFSDEYADIARKTFEKNGIKNVDVIVGDANQTLKDLAETITKPYDLIFIDADKVSYPNYLATILASSSPLVSHRLLRAGGSIVADNVLRRGLIADSSSANPSSQKTGSGGKAWKKEDMAAVKQFNDEMVTNPRLETFLMPLFDGLGMARLKD